MRNQSESPDQWLLRAGTGCVDSFSRLYDQCADALFGIALGILRDRDEAQEVLQDAFVAIWKNAARYDPSLGTATGWMIHLTRNLAIDRVRKRRRIEGLRRRFSEENEIQEQDVPASPLIDAETAGRVRSALKRLPGDQRQALDLAFFQGCTQTEIAEILREPLGTVKSRIRRAMERVKTLLEKNPITE
jgi:RNA polymerase sigma-70 factor (ECF subfamily)